MIVSTIHARGATTSPLPGSWCVHNTACRAAAEHGASGAREWVWDGATGITEAGQGDRALCLDLALGRLGS